MRGAETGEGWTEVFLSAADASSTAAAQDSFMRGHSLILLHDVASAVDCETLRCEASATSAAERCDPDVSLSPYFMPEKIRMPITDRLGSAGQALCEQLLLQAQNRLGHQLPALAERLFGTGCLDQKVFLRNPRLNFSIGEPAVNVYLAGGCFKAHKDRFSLSILLPLNSNGGGTVAAFGGGGTAFWSETDWAQMRKLRREEGEGSVEIPTLALCPPAGTALLFVGSVGHSGLPVHHGERCILVTSFSSTSNGTDGCDFEAAAVGVGETSAGGAAMR